MDTKPNDYGKHVVLLGMNHACSKADLRDRLLFTGQKLEAALEKISQDPHVLESLILSTCNRVEIYAVVRDPAAARQRLLAFFSDFHGIPVDEFEQHLYFFHCDKAAEHFFDVIASLDSMVVGETQILAQVKEAYRIAVELGNTGTVLNKLFHIGIEAGKRVRAETKIGDGILSISSAAVDLARKILGDLSASTSLVIGAGEMSELTARHLASAGIKKMYFANRTIENAQPLAEQFGGSAILLDEKETILAECDIVISATGAPHFIITPDQVKKVMVQRRHRALFCIDIAAPRDIHPDVGRIPNVFLYTIDDLSQVVSQNSQARANEIGTARAIVEEELEKYYAWFHSQKVLPTLVSLRKQFEDIMDEELARYGSQINALPEPSRKLIRQITASLTNKYLNNPSRILKDAAAASEDDGGMYARSIAAVFDLKVKNDE
jgi:glutamyl-tRNA reductase